MTVFTQILQETGLFSSANLICGKLTCNHRVQGAYQRQCHFDAVLQGISGRQATRCHQNMSPVQNVLWQFHCHMQQQKLQINRVSRRTQTPHVAGKVTKARVHTAVETKNSRTFQGLSRTVIMISQAPK